MAGRGVAQGLLIAQGAQPAISVRRGGGFMHAFTSGWSALTIMMFGAAGVVACGGDTSNGTASGGSSGSAGNAAAGGGNASTAVSGGNANIAGSAGNSRGGTSSGGVSSSGGGVSSSGASGSPANTGGTCPVGSFTNVCPPGFWLNRGTMCPYPPGSSCTSVGDSLCYELCDSSAQCRDPCAPLCGRMPVWSGSDYPSDTVRVCRRPDPLNPP
jgi:hypothetical protein